MSVAPEELLTAYPIGTIRQVIPISKGLMHTTLDVNAEAGRFIFQRLHHKLSTPEIVNDYAAVTAHLAARGAVSPRLVTATDGRLVVEDDQGRWWRLSTFIEGDTPTRVDRPEQALEGARALGRFHTVMADIPHTFGSQHPLHDMEGHLRRLEQAAARPEYREALVDIRDEVEEVAGKLSEVLLPKGLPQRVVHGDPKISNIMFKGDRAVAMIDLDTCMRHSVLVDLGDAVRSWCKGGTEDVKQAFQLDRFEALVEGYAETGPPLTEAELDLLPEAGRMITLELASRFLRDVLEDEYFAWDADAYPDRRSHNRARGRAMLHLANDMQAKRVQIDAVVQRLR
ncbi:MAG: phosphotransferase enzyme family protein [Bradymonadia bacterium]